MKTLVPPIKCQGIKTKLVPIIKQSALFSSDGTWIEPFCGSCVVALNVRPEKAMLADVNKHIIAFYQAIQNGTVTPSIVRAFLEDEGARLSRQGEAYYYEVRTRFNEAGHPLDFLFLSRACFNGVMRFNRSGKFNVPFCHKPDRFSPAYITKIVNQVRAFADVARTREWQFVVADFRDTLAHARSGDFVYVDPPYAGRHVDYYNSWTIGDENVLIASLKNLPCKFLLSTWQGNRHRTNQSIQEHWSAEGFSIDTFEHFYHVGATEDLRNAMIEACIANYPLPAAGQALAAHIRRRERSVQQFTLGFEEVG